MSRGEQRKINTEARGKTHESTVKVLERVTEENTVRRDVQRKVKVRFF